MTVGCVNLSRDKESFSEIAQKSAVTIALTIFFAMIILYYMTYFLTYFRFDGLDIL